MVILAKRMAAGNVSQLLVPIKQNDRMSNTAEAIPVSTMLLSLGTAKHRIRKHYRLASCLINAQQLLAHRPATDNNSLIGCTRPRPDRQLVADYAHFGASLGAFFY